jgi:hypothetical protein
MDINQHLPRNTFKLYRVLCSAFVKSAGPIKSLSHANNKEWVISYRSGRIFNIHVKARKCLQKDETPCGRVYLKYAGSRMSHGYATGDSISDIYECTEDYLNHLYQASLRFSPNTYYLGAKAIQALLYSNKPTAHTVNSTTSNIICIRARLLKLRKQVLFF